MLKRTYLFIVCMMAFFTLQSCTTISYNVRYNVNDMPVLADNNNNGSEAVTIISIGDNTELPSYQDELINIFWRLEQNELHFTLTNKSSVPLKIIWDECTFHESKNNTACRIIHDGSSIPEVYLNSISQNPTVVPAGGANHVDFIMPTSHVNVDRDDFEVDIDPIFYRKIKNSRLERFQNDNKNYVYTIHIPIVSNEIKHDYKFEFIIDSVVPRK